MSKHNCNVGSFLENGGIRRAQPFLLSIFHPIRSAASSSRIYFFEESHEVGYILFFQVYFSLPLHPPPKNLTTANIFNESPFWRCCWAWKKWAEDILNNWRSSWGEKREKFTYRSHHLKQYFHVIIKKKYAYEVLIHQI